MIFSEYFWTLKNLDDVFGGILIVPHIKIRMHTHICTHAFRMKRWSPLYYKLPYIGGIILLFFKVINIHSKFNINLSHNNS